MGEILCQTLDFMPSELWWCENLSGPCLPKRMLIFSDVNHIFVGIERFLLFFSVCIG